MSAWLTAAGIKALPDTYNMCVSRSHLYKCTPKGVLKSGGAFLLHSNGILKKISLKALIISLAVPLAAGGLSGFLIKDHMSAYMAAKHPPLSPPSIVFPIAWTALYVLMGISAYKVAVSASPAKQKALALHYTQLAVNFVWPLIFFNLEYYPTAFFWLLLLLILVIMMVLRYSQISKISAKLQIPYILWLVFAAYLNLGVAVLN